LPTWDVVNQVLSQFSAWRNFLWFCGEKFAILVMLAQVEMRGTGSSAIFAPKGGMSQW
jgi:hypothetical protein